MKPFISHDGADAKGVRAEVHVQVGEATVTKIEGLEGSGRNVQVILQSTHGAVTRPLKGWLQRTDPLVQKAVEAQQSGAVVNYRIESQRKAEVDRTLPIGPLRETTDKARENCIMILAGLDGVPSQEAVTNPAEDPGPGGRVPAAAQGARPGPPAAASGAPSAGLSREAALKAVAAARANDLPEGVVHAAMAQALATGASAQDVMSAGVDAEQQPRAVEMRTAYAVEAAPYKANNTDGRLNLGSHAVSAFFGAERFATSILVKEAEGDDPDAEVDYDAIARQAAALAEVLIDLADQVQVHTRGGGRPDRLVNSHTRARNLVFETIETVLPVPFGTSEAERVEWANKVVARCVERYRHLAHLASQRPKEIRVPQPDAQAQQQEQPQVQQEQPVEKAPAPQEVQQSAQQPVLQEVPAQAPQAQPQQAPAQQAPAQQAPAPAPAPAVRPGVVIEGMDGFVVPSEATMGRFAALSQAAGFEPTPDSPVFGFLQATFGVRLLRQVGDQTLSQMLDWYEARPDGAQKFAQRVRELPGLAMAG